MRENLLHYLKEKSVAASFDEIKEILNISSTEQVKQLLKEIDLLEKEMVVYRTRKNKYMLLENSHLKIGRLMVNKKGFGFVIMDEGDDIYVSEKNMNQAIHGDLVAVEVTRQNVKVEGQVIKIIKRELNEVIGEIYLLENKWMVRADDLRLNFLIEVKDGNYNFVEGSKVLVKLAEHEKNYFGEVIKVLGHKNDPGVDILALVYKYNFSDQFSDKTLTEIEKIANQIGEIGGRKDLRQEIIFTIDGDDTKDIDDAISLSILENKNYLLGVHIADVSYYVREEMGLDQDAFFRGTSVYLADRVVPMLPHKLSNGICSLNPDVDRYAISCEMEIDLSGEVVAYQIFESVICSKKQMTYSKVNKLLEENMIDDDYQEFVSVLRDMADLAKILRNNKIKRGYIDFDIDESKIIVDQYGKVIDIKLRERRTGEMLIEDFMIAANETVATAINDLELPFIYRVHGKPSEEKMNSFFGFVKSLGYQIPVPNVKKISSLDMQLVLEELKKQTKHDIFSKLLLRSMQKAIYDKNNIGHFGIGSDCYTHFTSPIRRYPDLIVHRLLRKYLFEHKIDRRVVDEWEKKLVVIGEHSSQKERDAIECEREVDDMKKAEYMQDHIGEIFKGIISGVMSFGLFVELDNGIEGLIKIESINDDYYLFNEINMSLKGERGKKVYQLGDEVKVEVVSVSKALRTIDFVLR